MGKLLETKCPGCGATWLPRVKEPIRCPRCSRVLVKGKHA